MKSLILCFLILAQVAVAADVQQGKPKAEPAAEAGTEAQPAAASVQRGKPGAEPAAKAGTEAQPAAASVQQGKPEVEPAAKAKTETQPTTASVQQGKPGAEPTAKAGTEAQLAAADAQRGKLKAETCLGCHGVPSYTNVYPSYHVPKLAGQHAEYLVAALKAYQSGARHHPTMHAQASKLSDTDMADFAFYFAKQPTPAAKPVEHVEIEVHESLKNHLMVCASCHNMDGNSPLAMNPRIAGQYRNYLRQSLYDYQQGKRKNPIMAGIVSTLNELDIELLSAYFARQTGLGVYHLGHGAPLVSE